MSIALLFMEINRGPWFIDARYAEAYRPVVEALIEKRFDALNALMPVQSQETRDRVMSEMQSAAMMASAPLYSFWDYADSGNMDKLPKGTVAITPLRGAITKYNYCGAPGTKTLGSWMKLADSHPNTIGHIIYTDTPGGSADGTYDFSEVIKGLQKPVIGFVDGLCASAGYWSLSGAKHIMAANPLCQIGSIGTYLTMYDWTKADAKEGIVKHEIYATASTEKNKEYREALKGNYKPILERFIDPFNEAFMGAVKRNRFARNLNHEKTLNGQLYLTADAVQYGLVDGTGTLADAVEMVKQLSNKEA